MAAGVITTQTALGNAIADETVGNNGSGDYHCGRGHRTAVGYAGSANKALPKKGRRHMDSCGAYCSVQGRNGRNVTYAGGGVCWGGEGIPPAVAPDSFSGTAAVPANGGAGTSPWTRPWRRGEGRAGEMFPRTNPLGGFVGDVASVSEATRTAVGDKGTFFVLESGRPDSWKIRSIL